MSFKLKNQLRDLAGLLKERDTEMEQLKRHIKVTKVEELQIENETVFKECKKLRKMLIVS